MRSPFKLKDPADIQTLAKLAKNGRIEGEPDFSATPTMITFTMFRSFGDGHEHYVVNDDAWDDRHQLRMPWHRFLALQGRAPRGWKGPAPLLLQGAYLLTMDWKSDDGFYDDVTTRLAAVLDT